MKRSAQPKPAVVFREKIIDEIFYALGLPRRGPLRRWLGPVFRLPAGRFGRIAAAADVASGSEGITGGARRILPLLSLNPLARGTGNIPSDGPLLVASNHPGAYDSVAILSCIPRKDMKVFISDVAFSRAFSSAGRYFIYTPKNKAGRMSALKTSIDHLQSGGSLLIFAHGEVEPDPEFNPGASEAIGDWSRSLEIMLRRVPEARLLVTIASGVLMPRFMKNPLVKIRKSAARRQKLAEVLQISQQMIFPRRVQTHIHISFAQPVQGKELAGAPMMPAVINIARRLLEDHMASFAGAGSDSHPRPEKSGPSRRDSPRELKATP
jgi:1-acyl-sn-glycerol-3-phosphate acyltransferase